jgi:hypothetical protein
MRLLLALIFAVVCSAGEVALDLPDPLIPGVQMAGSLRIVDPPANVTAVSLPPVVGLEWQLSGKNTSNSTIINGAASTVITVGLVLRGAARGRLDLPAVTVQLEDGSSMHSTPTQVRIDNGDARLTGDALAEASFEPARIVPGQPTSLVYRLYLRRGEVSTLGIAPPEGAITLGERSIASSQTVDAQGRAWTLTTITWPMTHSKPGSYVVRGQQDYQVVVGNVFNQRVSRGQVAVPPATLTVAELPTAGRPAAFTGLIGPLSATLTLDRQRVAASEGCLLSVIVSSRQTDLVKRPALAIPGVQCYPKDDRAEAGSRTFTWDVVPSAPGVITIPALTFPYFDPGSLSYRSADTASLTLTVIPGRNRELGLVGQTGAVPAPAQPEAPAAIALPQPLRGQTLPRAADWAGPAALAGGLLLGGGWTLIRRLRGSRRGPHRGAALRAAGRDPAALDAALRALTQARLTAEQGAALAAVQTALDRHRFGGEALPDLEPWLRVLGAVP